jgi:hypothetical protein
MGFSAHYILKISSPHIHTPHCFCGTSLKHTFAALTKNGKMMGVR